MKVHQHVDDTTQRMWHIDEQRLIRDAVPSAIAMLDEIERLGLTLSPKTTIVPKGPVADAIADAISKRGVTVSISNGGTDIGVECADNKRAHHAVLNSRIAKTRRRAKRAGALVKHDKTCLVLGRTRIKPAQEYRGTF